MVASLIPLRCQSAVGALFAGGQDKFEAFVVVGIFGPPFFKLITGDGVVRLLEAHEAVLFAAHALDHVGRASKAAKLDHLGARRIGAKAEIVGALHKLLQVEILIALVVDGVGQAAPLHGRQAQ